VFPEKNVGIGTSSPSKKFEVVGFGSSEQLVSLRGDNDLSLALRSVNNKAEVYYELADGNNGADNSWKIGTNDDGKLHFGYGAVGSFNSNEKMTILTTGNVGIGTTSPETQLHVDQTIKATKIVADGAVFTGMILMWFGSVYDIPTGWALCNGDDGTPDLKDKFIVATGEKYSVGNTGGADSVTLSVDQMPKHNHANSSISIAGIHAHEYWFDDENAGDGPSGIYPQGDGGIRTDKTQSTLVAGAHSHSLSISENGNNEPHENRPPYYALYFIMKIDLKDLDET
jgi:microcystin-dependent protein